MRSRLDAMGPVNMMALEEYKETAERHQFLSTQRKDLLDAIAEGELQLEVLEQIDYARMSELVTTYADLPLGMVDASVVAIAERLDV